MGSGVKPEALGPACAAGEGSPPPQASAGYYCVLLKDRLCIKTEVDAVLDIYVHQGLSRLGHGYVSRRRGVGQRLQVFTV